MIRRGQRIIKIVLMINSVLLFLTTVKRQKERAKTKMSAMPPIKSIIFPPFLILKQTPSKEETNLE